MVDFEEEDYFNGDDTDEEINTVTIGPQWTKSAAPLLSIPPISGFKTRRKRHGRAQTPSRPPAIQKQPLLGSLLDYDDEDEEPSAGHDDSPKASTSKSVLAPSPELLNSSIASTPLTSAQPQEEEDEEDRLLEGLVSPSLSSTSTSASPTTVSRSATPSPPSAPKTIPLPSITLPTPPRLAEKRRRDDEEEEDGLERLRKSKKTSTTTPKPGPNTNSATNSNANIPDKTKGGDTNKPVDEPPPTANRTWRVKVGGASWMSKLNPQKSSVASQPGAKDADTG